MQPHALTIHGCSGSWMQRAQYDSIPWIKKRLISSRPYIPSVLIAKINCRMHKLHIIERKKKKEKKIKIVHSYRYSKLAL